MSPKYWGRYLRFWGGLLFTHRTTQTAFLYRAVTPPLPPRHCRSERVFQCLPKSYDLKLNLNYFLLGKDMTFYIFSMCYSDFFGPFCSQVVPVSLSGPFSWNPSTLVEKVTRNTTILKILTAVMWFHKLLHITTIKYKTSGWIYRLTSSVLVLKEIK